MKRRTVGMRAQTLVYKEYPIWRGNGKAVALSGSLLIALVNSNDLKLYEAIEER